MSFRLSSLAAVVWLALCLLPPATLATTPSVAISQYDTVGCTDAPREVSWVRTEECLPTTSNRENFPILTTFDDAECTKPSSSRPILLGADCKQKVQYTCAEPKNLDKADYVVHERFVNRACEGLPKVRVATQQGACVPSGAEFSSTWCSNQTVVTKTCSDSDCTQCVEAFKESPSGECHERTRFTCQDAPPSAVAPAEEPSYLSETMVQRAFVRATGGMIGFAYKNGPQYSFVVRGICLQFNMLKYGDDPNNTPNPQSGDGKTGYLPNSSCKDRKYTRLSWHLPNIFGEVASRTGNWDGNLYVKS